MRWRKKPENTPELEERLQEEMLAPSDGISYALESMVTYGVFPVEGSDAVWIHEERRGGDGRRLLSALVKVERRSIPFVVECLQRYLPDEGASDGDE